MNRRTCCQNKKNFFFICTPDLHSNIDQTNKRYETKTFHYSLQNRFSVHFVATQPFQTIPTQHKWEKTNQVIFRGSGIFSLENKTICNQQRSSLFVYLMKNCDGITNTRKREAATKKCEKEMEVKKTHQHSIQIVSFRMNIFNCILVILSAVHSTKGT